MISVQVSLEFSTMYLHVFLGLDDDMENKKKTKTSIDKVRVGEDSLKNIAKHRLQEDNTQSNPNNTQKEDLEENANGPMLSTTTQKIASLLPPPPLLIRPTPVSQSRESIVLNNNGKFWNHGDQIYHI